MAITITAAAFIFAEALNAGMSIADIMAEAREKGLISPETWSRIMSEMEESRGELGLTDTEPELEPE